MSPFEYEILVMCMADDSTRECGSASPHDMCAVGGCSSRSQSRSDENGFGNFLIRRIHLPRLVGVEFDAIRTLGCTGDGDCHQFLVLYRNRSLSKSCLVEGHKSLHRLERIRL